METNEKAVETKEPAATPTGVETTAASTEADPEIRLREALDKLQKAERDRDNYRTGMLKAKGKIASDDDDLSDPEKLQAFIKEQVKESLTETEYGKAIDAVKAEAEKLALKNRELARALQSKNASTSISGGTSAGTGEVPKSEATTAYFSPDQVAELKKRGFSDDQIRKAETLAKSGSPGTAAGR